MSAGIVHDHAGLAKPPHVQHVEMALQLEPLLSYVEDIIKPQNLHRYGSCARYTTMVIYLYHGYFGFQHFLHYFNLISIL